jgi:hypothetical protein
VNVFSCSSTELSVTIFLLIRTSLLNTIALDVIGDIFFETVFCSVTECEKKLFFIEHNLSLIYVPGYLHTVMYCLLCYHLFEFHLSSLHLVPIKK